MHPLCVVVDDREWSSGVTEALLAREDIRVFKQRLSIGDYIVEGKVTAERKTLKDFAVSLVDGRLFSQTLRLANAPGRTVLILEGGARDIADLGVSREALQGALITVTVFLGLPVLRSRDSEETARLLLYIGRQWRSVQAGGIKRPGRRPKGKRARQMYLLQGLPGIGPKRAARLLDSLGSLRNILTATADVLAGIEGIGPDTAQKIRWTLEETKSEDQFGF